MEQSHWSVLIDLLIDIHVNVKPLNAREVMGYVAFCALETNGTTLPVGIVSSYLKTRNGCKCFREGISRNGMYYTLLCKSIELAQARETLVNGSSMNPRHVGHNRSYLKDCTNPIAGFPSPFSGYDPKSSTEYDEQCMKSHCARIEKELITLCARITTAALKKKESGPDELLGVGKKKRELLEEFLDDVKIIAGKGCSGIYCLNFLQLAGYFGFLPTKLLASSTINTQTSGGYKFILSLYPGITPKDAQKYFKESIAVIQKIFGSSFTFAIAENMLCELYRDRNGTNRKKDVTFFFNHRSNQWGGLQNFFRIKENSGLNMNLEMLGVPRSKNCRGGCMQIMSWANGIASGQGSMKWTHIPSSKNVHDTISFKSELRISKEIASFYTIIHPSINGKRKRS